MFTNQTKIDRSCEYLIILTLSTEHRMRTVMFHLRTAAFKAYSAILVRRSNFRHQESPRVSPRESTQRRKEELWARNVR